MNGAVLRVREKLGLEFIVGAVFVSAMFMVIMDVTVVNVAIPTIAEDFGATNAQVQWVVTGYLLSLALFVPASGWLGDRFGAKRVLLLSLALFTLASALCAAANGLEFLVAARVIQGVGGGMLQPVGMALLFRTFPPERRARASQILIVPTAIAPALGPIVGGLLVEHASWRWVFLINLPIGIAAFVFAALFLDRDLRVPVGRFDVAGFVLAGAGLGLLLYAVSQGPNNGWTSPTVLVTGITSVVLLTALVLVELRVSHPLLDLHLLSNRLFLDCTLVMVVGFGAFLGTLFIVPLYLQQARGFSAQASGFVTFTEALGVLVFTQVAGRLYPRIGPRRLTASGLFFLCAVLITGSFLFDDSTGLWLIRLFMFGMGAGFAFVLMSQQAAAFATISHEDMGQASALSATMRQAASALGVALLATVLSSQTAPGVPPAPDDFGPVFLTAAAMALAGAFIALRIRDSDAAATMHPLTVTEEFAGIDLAEVELDPGAVGPGAIG